MKFARPFAVAVSLMFVQLSWAEEAVHHEVHGAVQIPWGSVFVQFANLSILLGVLGYLMRVTIVKHFENRRSTYLELVKKAESAREEAERSRREIFERLEALESSTEQSLAQATSDSEELRQRIISEAEDLSNKLAADAQRATQHELERAKLELRRELLNSGLESARGTLQTSVGGAEQKKLQNEFVEKIQVVR